MALVWVGLVLEGAGLLLPGFLGVGVMGIGVGLMAGTLWHHRRMLLAGGRGPA